MRPPYCLFVNGAIASLKGTNLSAYIIPVLTLGEKIILKDRDFKFSHILLRV
jgi:hypothetical protein